MELPTMLALCQPLGPQLGDRLTRGEQPPSRDPRGLQ